MRNTIVLLIYLNCFITNCSAENEYNYTVFSLKTVTRIVSGKVKVLNGSIQESNMDIEFCRNALSSVGIEMDFNNLKIETYSFRTKIRSKYGSTYLECIFYKTDINIQNPKFVNIKNDISQKGSFCSLIKQYKAPVYSYYIDCRNNLCFISHIGLPISYSNYDSDEIVDKVKEEFCK